MQDRPDICLHRTPERWEWCDVEVGLFGEMETQLVKFGGEGTYKDLDVGRFQCTQCGEVGYYTGLWRRYHEEGVPCIGSAGVPRVRPSSKD